MRHWIGKPWRRKIDNGACCFIILPLVAALLSFGLLRAKSFDIAFVKRMEVVQIVIWWTEAARKVAWDQLRSVLKRR